MPSAHRRHLESTIIPVVLAVAVVCLSVTACGGAEPDASTESQTRQAAGSATEQASGATSSRVVEQPDAMPEPTLASEPETPSRPQQHRYGEDPAQFGMLFVPAEAERSEAKLAPVVVLLHGGFWAEPWDYTLMHDVSQALANRGVATWNLEFRRLGGRGGWPATFDDVVSAVNHLTELAQTHPLDLDRLIAVGHSSGGHLALWLARPDVETRPAIGQAIGVGAITDLTSVPAAATLLGASETDDPQRWAAAAPSMDPERVSLVHGTDDTIITPISILPAMLAGVETTWLLDANHLEPITEGDDGFDRLIAAIVAKLPR